jgi:hypothetical protein
VHSYVAWRLDLENASRSNVITVQFSALVTLLLGIAVVCSLLLLETGAVFRWKAAGTVRWIACRVADYGPALFLCASVLFLASFRPLAEVFARYRSAEQSNTEAMGLFWRMFVLGEANPLQYFYNPYHQWLTGTIVLAAIAVIVLVRGVMRCKADSIVTR